MRGNAIIKILHADVYGADYKEKNIEFPNPLQVYIGNVYIYYL